MRAALAIALAAFLAAPVAADAKPRKPAKTARQAKDASPEAAAVEAAKLQLRIARENARVARAKARVHAAIEACHQAVVDRCVEFATPESPAEGPGSCMDEALRAEFQAECTEAN